MFHFKGNTLTYQSGPRTLRARLALIGWAAVLVLPVLPFWAWMVANEAGPPIVRIFVNAGVLVLFVAAAVLIFDAFATSQSLLLDPSTGTATLTSRSVWGEKVVRMPLKKIAPPRILVVPGLGDAPDAPVLEVALAEREKISISFPTVEQARAWGRRIEALAAR